MQALGNDFVVLSEGDLLELAQGKDLLKDWRRQGPKLARWLCDRHFGVGADGLILVCKTDRKDCQLSWSYLNSDGSFSRMCGNGVRCLALYALDRSLIGGAELLLSTEVGPVKINVRDAQAIESYLGEPVLDSIKVPVGGAPRAQVVGERIEVGGHSLTVTCLSMGNPHCVVFDSRLTRAQQEALAPAIQSLAFFPESVNVEFVEVSDRTHARVFVWERGAGPTLACASGAAAAVVAGVMEDRLDREVTIELPGGRLVVAWSKEDNQVRITGPAAMTFRGVVDLAAFVTEVVSA
jgi:diaminopimelate epimerase